MSLDRIASIDDLRIAARRRLPRIVFDYMEGGAESESGLARNRAAFERLRLVPRYLNDVAERSIATDLFGRTWSMPFGIAPTGLAGIVWPQADLMLARAAHAANVPFVLSTASTETIEDVGRAAPGSWFQLYAGRDMAIVEDLVRRARESTYDVLIVTVDIPVPGKRERDIRNGFTLPLRPTLPNILDVFRCPSWALATAKAGPPKFVNFTNYMTNANGAQTLAQFMAGQISASFDWAALAKVRQWWPKTLLVKGLLHTDDIVRAADAGVDGVILSNHGGRQIDAGPAPIEMLPAAVAAVKGRIPLMLDSGVRRGADVLRALSLGASFCFAGRPMLYGVAMAGEAGVAKALAILRDELDRGLGQLGCSSPRDLGPERVLLSDWR
jgi:(S)-mandelate dehydrogenase